jgi:bacterioferritin
MRPTGSKGLLDLLNQGIASELQVSIQYMWQHIQWTGVAHFALKDELKKTAIAEMKHAEIIAERLFYLGGIPTIVPEPIAVGTTLKDMIAQDIKAEEATIDLYKRVIRLAETERDVTTAEIIRDILEEEEGHHDFFTGIMDGMGI